MRRCLHQRSLFAIVIPPRTPARFQFVGLEIPRPRIRKAGMNGDSHGRAPKRANRSSVGKRPVAAGRVFGKQPFNDSKPSCEQRSEATLLTDPLHTWRGCHCPGYLITASARSRIDWGIVIPRAFIVLKLTTNSNLAGCSTGRSPGFAPLRILSTSFPDLRN